MRGRVGDKGSGRESEREREGGKSSKCSAGSTSELLVSTDAQKKHFGGGLYVNDTSNRTDIHAAS